MVPSSPYDPPLGWRSFCGLLEADTSIAGHAARHESVRGHCRNNDCKRTVTVDLEGLLRSGLGRMDVKLAQRFLMCQSLSGCNLSFHVEKGIGLRLDQLVGKPLVQVRFQCRGCKFFRVTLPDKVIDAAREKAKTTKEHIVTLDQLRAAPMEPCQKCGKTNWQVDVLWPERPTDGREYKAYVDAQRR